MTLKLLLVGKEKSVFQPIKDAFENDDVDIILATSIGLAIFLARKNQPNLIISQQELADSDAASFICELKNEQELARIPAVLLDSGSNKSNYNNVQDKLEKGNISDCNIHSLSLDKGSDLSSSDCLRSQILAFIGKPTN
jgi:CheY-like chemotaxis protein